jgi:hypothetical protein
VASLEGGLGSEEMAPFVANPRVESILEKLAEEWVQYGHTTLRILEKTSRHRVRLVSKLDRDVVVNLGFDPCDEPGAVINRWRGRFSGERIGVMASGTVFPRA